MKALKIALIAACLIGSMSSCIVVRHPGPGRVWVRGHYDVGPYGGRHWVPGHWDR